MPRVEYGLENVPDRAHLGLMTSKGTAIAIPPGATILIIEDPTRADKITPLILIKVSNKSIDFACACGNKACTRRIRYTASRSGTHPSMGNTRPMAFSRDE